MHILLGNPTVIESNELVLLFVYLAFSQLERLIV